MGTGMGGVWAAWMGLGEHFPTLTHTVAIPNMKGIIVIPTLVKI